MNEHSSGIKRMDTPVKVQVGGGATPPKVRLERSSANDAPVKVQIGGGATPPKVALQRARQ